MRSRVLAALAADGGHAATSYEERKRQHLNTATQCQAQGIQFQPLVAEACGGGWGPGAVKVWKQLAALVAARSGASPGEAKDQLMQSLSVALQRENARALLRRLPAAEEVGPGLADPQVGSSGSQTWCAHPRLRLRSGSSGVL
jgi:hypothetical protein